MRSLPPIPECDPSELELDEAYGDHNIEYWVWSGKRLVPATPDQIATIHTIEDQLHITRRQFDEVPVGQKADRAAPRQGPGNAIALAFALVVRLLRGQRQPSAGHDPACTTSSSVPAGAAEPGSRVHAGVRR